MRSGLDWRGHRIGALTVMRLPRRATRWRCRCDCGRVVDIPFSRLETGRVRFCGHVACQYRDTVSTERRKLRQNRDTTASPKSENPYR